MLTLHNVTEYTKKSFKWGIIALFGFLGLIFLYQIGVGIKEYYYPTPPPPPTVSFGKLPQIKFPQLYSGKIFTYSINTVAGTLPVFPDRATIYKLKVNEPNLLALKRAQKKVAQVGFTSSAIPITNTLYEWKDFGAYSSLSRNLVLDIQSFDFTLTSEFLTNPDVLTGNNLPNEAGAISTAQSFLENLSFLEDLDLDKTKTTLLTIKDSSVINATSLSSSQIIRADFFQKDINNLPIYYPNPPYSTINIFIGGGTSQGQAVEAHVLHRAIDDKESATYPIKTANVAFEELKKGNSYIASFNSSEAEISIKNIFLGYYLGDKEQKYLMPVIIFEGSSGFYAYVSAIKDAWIQNEIN